MGEQLERAGQRKMGDQKKKEVSVALVAREASLARTVGERWRSEKRKRKAKDAEARRGRRRLTKSSQRGRSLW